MHYIGCHLSSSAGFAAMGRTALSIGANTFQFFTRNPRGSRAKPVDPADGSFWPTPPIPSTPAPRMSVPESSPG